RSPPQPSPGNQDRRPVQPAARPADRPAHPHRPGRPAADPGHRDQPSADHQAQPGPGPPAGPAGRGPDPPAMTPDPATEVDLCPCANYRASRRRSLPITNASVTALTCRNSIADLEN